ncbi:MAG: polyprenyl synthetase family protein [Candidatus Nealsonbacteria bacterium]|nr:polyprenyl synthetase family protein [Candidatus Nealsonbacteria bacterium]
MDQQLVNDQAKLPAVLQALYAPVRKELDAVEETLQRELHSDYPFVDRLARHGFRLGGKRLRPALVLLAGKASGTLTPAHVDLAAAVELIHTATLVHDDVLDEAILRRHLDTVNARWDNEASVLLGDFLFTRAICLSAEVDGSFACRSIGEAAQTMCEGELRQIESRGNYELTEEEYLDIITNKTAALTACCCRLGSHYADAEPEVCEALARFGRYLGVAFQIADDLLDLLGDEETAGKSLGTDLIKQKATLPLIRLLDRADSSQRDEVIALLTADGILKREALHPWLERFDVLPYTREKAISYTRLAGEQLESLPPSEARDVLKGLTDFVVTRRQ